VAAGTVQTLFVCVASAFPQAPCPAGMAIGTVQGYVLDVAQAANIDASTAPFDYVYAAGLWSLAFTFVLSLYFVSKSTGTILNFIRGRG